MRISVIGGTGLVGSATVEALRREGHEAVVAARSTGVDVMTGTGLDDALAGCDAVIDVTNVSPESAEQSREFFGTTTEHLLAAEQRAGVGHHVVLSIVGIERVPGNAHYAGKRRQEEVATAGPIPVSILRATQFHDFAAMVVGWMTDDGVATVPPLLVQPVAVSDVADVLVELATTTPPPGGTRELAGPETQDLVDMARRTLAARGESVRLTAGWRGMFGVEMAGEVLLPGPDAQLAPTTFEDWLTQIPHVQETM
jgi:uncharacterized protein YbjT (DUF2867 family)